MEKRKYSVNIILVVFVMIFIVGEVFILNKYSTMGDELTQINQKIIKIEKENDNLSQKIASSSSMTEISQKAKQYGIALPTQIVSLGTSLPLAANAGISL